MPKPSNIDARTQQRIEKARKEALQLLNGSPEPSPSKPSTTTVPPSPSPPSPPTSNVGKHSPSQHTYHTTTRVGGDNVEHSTGDPKSKLRPSHLEVDKSYTPGKIYEATVDTDAEHAPHFSYPSYKATSSPAQSHSRPAFRPSSVKVSLAEPSPLHTSLPSKLVRSLNGSPSSPSPPRANRSPNSTKTRTPSSFTSEEVCDLVSVLSTSEGQLRLKRLVSPSIKKIKESLVQLLTRVINRGEALGDADKALTRSFEVFAGRKQTSTSCVAFADKLGSLSVSWSSYTHDECLALALSLSSPESSAEGIITMDDFKRFSIESTDTTEQIQRGRSISNFAADDKEMDEDYMESINTSIMASLAKTDGSAPPPKSFLEEKFQHLCIKARTLYGVNIWGWIDRIAVSAQATGSRKPGDATSLMNAFIAQMNAAPSLNGDVPPPI